jgi:integrase
VPKKFPKLCHHRKSGRAYVTIDGRQRYLGAWGSQEAEHGYAQLIARLAATATQPDAPQRVGEPVTLQKVVAEYLKYARGHYADANGSPSSAYATAVRTLQVPVELFGDRPADQFDPRAMRATMEQWVAKGWVRASINKSLGVVKRAFRWAAAEGWVDPATHQRLMTVEGLRAGRTVARDNPKVMPADLAAVNRAIEVMRPAIAAITRLMLHSGARCDELCKLRPADLDRSQAVWTFAPARHKGTWRGKGRTIFLGAVCREALAPYLAKCPTPESYLFCPRREEAERNAERSASRVTPKWASHMRRNETKRAKAKRAPLGDRYTTASVRQAMKRACKKLGIPEFKPHQLRHLAATLIRAEFGIEHARAMLGQSFAGMTEVYSREVDRQLATEAAAKMG